jgi:serine/threonine-protein kinase
LVEGKTLEGLLEAGKAFTPEEVSHIGVELCHAMTAVHRAGLLHRDIKAHNVMLADAGRVVLTDFGTGREVGDQSTGPVAGTPLYLAPEIFSGAPASVRSDIYSAGVLLYRLLTGGYPVAGRTLDDLRLAHERGERTALKLARPDLPRRLCRVVERALDGEPDRRYESAQAMAGDLSSLGPRAWRGVLPYAAAGAAALLLLAAWLVPSLRDSLRVGTSDARSRPGVAIAGASGTTTRAAVPVIAVLPLTNLSAEAGSDYFADGLTDEIIRDLATIDGLEVRSRTSSFSFKHKPRNLSDVGRQLGATFVVEGSVLRDGRRLRINAQLVQVDGDVLLWSERFDRELADVFAVQDEISRAIVNKLRLSVGQGRRRYDTDVELYDLYLKARGLLETRQIGPEAQEAAKLFEEVVARDSAFAPAYAGLATAYAYMSNNPYAGKEFDAARSRLRPAALKALQLDPLLAEAHAAMGWVHAREFDWPNAERSFERALEINRTLTPISINYVYSTLRALGKLEYSERLLREALRHDPLSGAAERELAGVLLQAGQYQQVIDITQRFRAADPHTVDFYVDRDLGRALTFTGRHEEAIAVLTSERFAGPGSEHWCALPYVKTGRRDAVEKLAIAHQGYPFRLAFIYAALGDENRALEALERMFATEPQRLALTMMQPELAMLRDDARWIALRRKLKVPQEPQVQPRS